MSKQDERSVADMRGELQQLLDWFESEDFTPEEAVEKFRQAETLAEQIEKRLIEHQNTISVLKKRFDEAKR